MKSVLIVDPVPIFREFLKDKLSFEKIDVVIVQEKRDAIMKIASVLPELVLIDINEFDDVEYITELFQSIKADPNASRIPMIATGPALDKTIIASFAKYGVLKYFVKPIQFDVFFESIGRILRTTFTMDSTPCVLDIHRNGNIVFIEIAQGLNREKLSILKYKLSEIIENNELDSPKIVLMMTNLELSFIDGLNLELLLDNILANPKVHAKNVKVLSFSDFTQQLIDGHPQYDGIEVATDISRVLNSLVDSTTTSRVSDLITDKILTNTQEEDNSSIEMRFSSDTVSEKKEVEEKPVPINKADLKVAVVDDDAVILKLVSAGFSQAGIKCELYSNAIDFLANLGRNNFSAIVLDILMPGISGIDTLKRIYGSPNRPPVLIYSQALTKELVMQAMTLGVKAFLKKPQKPDDIVKKVLECLNATK